MISADEETRLFSSMKAVETWLTDNNFVYGQRSFFKYPQGDKHWFHKDDLSLEYIDVDVIEMDVDDTSESKFKNLAELHREWLPKFLKELADDEQQGD